jgi:histidinol-phosphatase (PHP family)
MRKYAELRNFAKAAGCRFSSIHTHTLFCDGDDDVESMCRAAFEKGVSAAGFSAHAPLLKKTGIKTDWHIPDERLDEYFSEVSAARLRWKDRLPVYAGLELDYIKGLRSALDDDIQKMRLDAKRGISPLDYIIGSVHYVFPVNSTAPFAIDGSMETMEENVTRYFNGNGEAVMHAYFDALGEMISLGGIDILGHADIIKKNNQNGRWFDMESPAYTQRLAETAHAAAAAGIVVEVNTGGMNRGKTSDTYPSLPFLRKLREKNVPVMVSADAHRACDIDGNYETARKTLLAAGYREHALFEGRKNGAAVWRFEKLSE